MVKLKFKKLKGRIGYYFLNCIKIDDMILSACGLVCDECEFYNNKCTGCISVKGSTFWAKEMMPDKTCPLYGCAVNKKGLKSCGGCAELPCKLFRDMKDPNTSEEEHLKMIGVRVARMRAN